MKHIKKFEKLNESSSVDSAEYGFQKTEEYKKASKEISTIVDKLEIEFYKWCEDNGHEDAEGDTDYDITFGNISNSLIERY
jgi:hypothetical protein